MAAVDKRRRRFRFPCTAVLIAVAGGWLLSSGCRIGITMARFDLCIGVGMGLATVVEAV